MVTPDDGELPKKNGKRRRDTATAAQYAKILAMLKPRGSVKSTHDFRREGVMQPAARLKELRDIFGCPIQRVALRTIWDDWGYQHKNVAFYSLIEPTNKRPL